MEVFVNVLFGLFVLVISVILIGAIIVFASMPILKRKLKRIDEEIDLQNDDLEQIYEKKSLYQKGKRVFDIIASLIGIIVLSPLYVIYALSAMKVKQNILVKRKIVGHRNRHIFLYKFRYEQEMPRICKVLYNAGIDQAPVYFNALRGDLSLVGVTKMPEELVTEKQKQMLQYERPGIVALSNLFPFDFERIELYDNYYLLNRGFRLDILIILCACIMVKVK